MKAVLIVILTACILLIALCAHYLYSPSLVMGGKDTNDDLLDSEEFNQLTGLRIHGDGEIVIRSVQSESINEVSWWAKVVAPKETLDEMLKDCFVPDSMSERVRSGIINSSPPVSWWNPKEIVKFRAAEVREPENIWGGIYGQLVTGDWVFYSYGVKRR